MSEPVQMICGRCGSADVTADGVGVWCPEAQEWTWTDALDGRSCNCCCEDDNLVEMPFDQWQIQELDNDDSPHPDGKHWVSGVHDGWKYVAAVKADDDGNPGDIVWMGDAHNSLREAKDAARVAIANGKVK